MSSKSNSKHYFYLLVTVFCIIYAFSVVFKVWWKFLFLSSCHALLMDIIRVLFQILFMMHDIVFIKFCLSFTVHLHNEFLLAIIAKCQSISSSTCKSSLQILFIALRNFSYKYNIKDLLVKYIMIKRLLSCLFIPCYSSGSMKISFFFNLPRLFKFPFGGKAACDVMAEDSISVDTSCT